MGCAAAQVLVDVLGVVTSVGAMRSIKRKNDGTEFFCRDITIADAGCAARMWRPLHASVTEERILMAWVLHLSTALTKGRYLILQALCSTPRRRCTEMPEHCCRGHTVGLTLWGESAEVQGAELEQSEDAIISVSSCRVGEFNGAPTCRTSLHLLSP